MQTRIYYVYIVASKSRTLYVGITNDLVRRVQEHKQGRIRGFTKRYRVTRLVFFEATHDPRSAIARRSRSSPGAGRRSSA